METKNNGDIGHRISELIFRLGKNQSSFAESVRVSQTAISKTIKGQSKPGYELLETILNSYPQVNKEWLMSGVGEMFINPVKSEDKRETTIINTNSDGGTMLNALKDQYEKRIDELTRYVSNLEYTVNLQKKMLGNFNGPTIGKTGVMRPMWSEDELLTLQNQILAIG